MKHKMLMLAAAGLLPIARVAYGFSATSSKSTCPLEGTSEWPKINCPLAGTPDSPYDAKAALPACCYEPAFYRKTEKQVIVVDKTNIQTTRFTISGMTCSGCEAHVTRGIKKLPGIISSIVSYKDSSAIVQFDNARVSAGYIEKRLIIQ